MLTARWHCIFFQNVTNKSRRRTSANSMAGASYDVVIVGGGIAGISAVEQVD